jgi:hypothetical protein
VGASAKAIGSVIPVTNVASSAKTEFPTMTALAAFARISGLEKLAISAH